MNLRSEIKKCYVLLDELQDKTDSISVNRYNDARKKLAELLVCEEDYWQQRAKVHWLRDGDFNTRYFHAQATIRKKAKRIKKLVDDNGILHETEARLCMVAHDYFLNIFLASHGVYEPVLEAIWSCVSVDSNELLLQPFTKEEFRCALFQMHPDKSTGPDELNPILIKNSGMYLVTMSLQQGRVGLSNVLFLQV